MTEFRGRTDGWLTAGWTIPAGLLLVIAVSLLLPTGFWVLDESFRYLQMSSLAESFELPPAIRLPGASLAGEQALQTAPVPYHYGRMEGGRVFSQYSPALALLSLPAAEAARIGIYLVPAAGFSAFWLLLFMALRRNGFGRIESGLLPLLGTPLLFYGLSFWAHAPAAALVLAAVLSTVRKGGRSWVPYAVLTAAVLLREEALPMFAVPLLLGRASPGRKAFLLLASAVLILTFTKVLTGAWLGTHIQASGAEQALYGHHGMGYLPARVYVVFMSLLTFFPGAPVWVNAAGGVLLFGLWGVVLRGSARSRGKALFIGLVICTAALAAAVFRGFRLMDSLYFLKNPLVICPALWLVRPNAHSLRLPLVLLGVLLAMEAFMSPMHVEDLAWGSRLTMLPIISMLVMMGPDTRRRTYAVLAAGLLSCVVSVGFLATKRSTSAELIGHAVMEGDAIIVTNWMLTGEFAREMEAGMPVFFTSSTSEFAGIMDSLGDLRPVVVSLLEDIPGQLAAFERAGFDASVSRVVEFDPSLRVAILRSDQRGPP